ncbi:GNAT family N-acetyltransferase [Paucibacter sp. APW11]|uniref:GNAT family N-acetyltransferase n=1 Tax=Roseateles aquae TaxID=3077235 RepID=A0ABU3P6T4_9BURK|nr:GNAT family N-acetyltransferase [Paucibacter sp. APW11]MDT8997935.1 GNAT family N-acetyltransferase [Paucibacter sp. APW11]
MNSQDQPDNPDSVAPELEPQMPARAGMGEGDALGLAVAAPSPKRLPANPSAPPGMPVPARGPRHSSSEQTMAELDGPAADAGTWQVRKLADVDASLMQGWDELKRRMFGDHPMLSRLFIANLLKHFKSGKEQLCYLERDGQWQAALIAVPSHLGQWALFLPVQAQLGAALLHRVGQLQGLFDKLPGACHAIDLLCQDPLLLDTNNLDPRRIELIGHALTIAVPLQGGFDAYWGSRSSKLRQNIRRYLRKVAAANVRTSFRVLHEDVDIAAGLKRYAALEASGWKGRAGTALSPESQQFGFYRDTMSDFAGDGRALVFELWFDDTLVASRLVLVGASRIVFLKTSYDENFADYSPGRLMLHHVMEHLFRHYPGRRLEFFTNADTDLLAWASESRPISHLRVYRDLRSRTAIHLLRRFSLLLGRDKHKSEAGPSNDVEHYTHPSQFPADVLAFMERCEGSNLEFGADWFALQVDHALTPDQRPHFYVLRVDGRVHAMLPVLLNQGERLGPELGGLTNFYTSLFAPILQDGIRVDRLQLAALVRAVKKDHRAVARWSISPMDPGLPSYQLLMEAMRLVGLVPLPYFRFGNWYMPKQEWPSYWAARDSQLRSTVKRRGKKFAERGGRLEVITDMAEVERGIAGYEAVYASSWKRPEPFPHFVPGLIRLGARRGWLRLGVAWLDDKAIAAQIWLVNGGKASIFKLAYDEAYKELSAGTLLSAALFEHVLSKDAITELDYLIGDDDYKRTWVSHRRERWGIVAYNPGTIRGLAGLIYELLGRSVKRLLGRFKKSPAADAA